MACITNSKKLFTLTREYRIISCSSQVYDFPTGVGNNKVLCGGVDSFT